MSGHLERRAPRAGGLARGGAHTTETGQATSLSQLTFASAALDYTADLPRAFRSGVRASTEVALRSGKEARSGGELILASAATPTITAPRSDAASRRIEKATIASGVRQLDKPRKASGRVVQRRIGWQATPDLIIITTAERELEKTASGKYAPSGDWMIEDRRTYKEANGRAAKRTGNVSADDEAPAADAAAAGTPGFEATVAEKFPEGAQALGALPAAVRSSAIARVPSPRQFDGVILQYSDPGTQQPSSLEVNVLRMDAERAVVIQATRSITATVWEVAQATYKLAEPEIEQA